MTKSELIKELEPYPNDFIIFLESNGKGMADIAEVGTIGAKEILIEGEVI